VTRITVVYGPNTPANSTDYGVVSRFAHNLILGKPITLYGEGAQTRDFVYIDDVVDALLRLGACDRAIGRAFNIGNSRPITLLNLAQTLIRVAGHGELLHVPWPADAQKVETGNFYADVSLMRHVTGWRPQTSLEEGLRNVLQFMRRRHEQEQNRVPVNV
jgi:nucleoside-diphosphate-sugar epimerase